MTDLTLSLDMEVDKQLASWLLDPIVCHYYREQGMFRALRHAIWCLERYGWPYLDLERG